MLEHQPGKRLVAQVLLDPAADAFLAQHRFRGRPMLPLVLGLEAFAEASRLLGGRAVAAMADVQTADALHWLSEGPIAARIVAELTDQGVACRLLSDVRNRSGKLLQSDRLHLSALVELSDDRPPLDLSAPWLPSTWYKVDYPDEAMIYHGPLYRCLYEALLSDGGGWGRLRAPSAAQILGSRAERPGEPSVSFDAAMVDASFFTCGVCVWLQADRAVAIPHRLKRLRLGRMATAGEECIVRMVRLQSAADRGAFDFTIFGADGAALVAVQRYEAVLVTGGKIEAKPEKGNP